MLGNNNKIEISHKTIFFIVGFIGSIWVILQIRDILLLLFVSFILMASLATVVDRLENLYLPRPLAILMVYIIVLSVVGTIGTILVPPLVTETIRLVSLLPTLVNPFFPQNSFSLETVVQQVLPVGTGVVRFSVGIFSNFLSVITLLVITFYFLLERRNLKEYLANFLGESKGNKIYETISEIEVKLGAWVRGELALMSIIGLMTYLGLLLFNIEYALPLAIFAGILELVPIIGPIISAIPAVLVALAVSPSLALIMIVLYIVIQQLENNLIVPSIMRRALGIPPIITILALMVGGRLAGFGGALLSVPIVLVVQVILSKYLK